MERATFGLDWCVCRKQLHTALWWPYEIWHECFRAALCPPKKPTFKLKHFHSSVVRAKQILQDSMFGVPSGETHCLYHNTVGHFPSALFQGVLTEPPSQTLGPAEDRRLLSQGPCSGGEGGGGTCWVPWSAPQHCMSGEEKLVYPTKEVDGTSLFILTIRDFRKLKTCNSTYLCKIIQTYIELKNGITLYYQSLNSSYSIHLKF